MPNQLAPENSAIKLDKKYLRLIVWNAPLEINTHCVQTTETAFIADIPLYLKFLTRNCLLSEIAFWTFFYHFLRSNDFWSISLFGVKHYYYE